MIWVSQREDEESAGPVAADALEAPFDLGDPCQAPRTGERAYQFPSINGRACNSKTSAICECLMNFFLRFFQGIVGFVLAGLRSPETGEVRVGELGSFVPNVLHIC